jgi:hypothetical protein
LIGEKDGDEEVEVDHRRGRRLRLAGGLRRAATAATIDVSPIDTASNYSVLSYALPKSTDPVTVLMYGRGLAFSCDWSTEGTVSLLMEG